MSTVSSSRPGRRRLPFIGRSVPARDRGPRSPFAWKRYVVGAVVLGLAFWFAPLIIANTPLFQSILGSVTADLNGTVRAQSASLSWFAPIVLTDLEVRDAEGEPLAEAPKAYTSRTLFSLITSSGDPGLTLEKPKLAIRLSDDGSNLEQLLEKILKSPEPSEAPFTFTVNDAELRVLDETARREWTVDKFDLKLTTPGMTKAPLSIRAKGVIDGAEQAAPFELQAVIREESIGGAASGEIRLQAARFPLEMLDSLARRSKQSGIRDLSGTLNANLNADWETGSVGLKTFAAKGNIVTQDLRFASAASGHEPIVLRHLELPLDVQVKNGGLDVKRLDMKSDWGTLTARGRLADWQAWARGEVGWSSLAPLARSEGNLVGEVDIAALARVMPGVLKVREGTEVTSGSLAVNLTSESSKNGWVWNADLRTSRIEAVHHGRRIAWDKPIEVTFAAEDAGQGVVVKKLLAQADFLQVQGEGNADYLSLAATYELDRLAQELSRFIDLRDWQLAGEGWTYLTWQRKSADSFAADADLQVRGLSLSVAGQNWREENLVCNVDVGGTLDKAKMSQIDRLDVTMTSGADGGSASLAAPIPWQSLQKVWPLDVQLAGRLERWLARAALVTDQVAAWKASGDAQLDCRVDLAREKIDVPRFELKATGVQLQQFGMLFQEPSVEMTGSGSFSGSPLRWELREMTMKTSSLNARARNVVGAYSSNGAAEISGNVELAADLAGLTAAWRNPVAPSPWQVAGKLTANGSITARDGVLSADLNSTIKQFAARYGQGPVVNDPEVRITAKGNLDTRRQAIKLERGAVESQSLRLRAEGSLSDLERRRDVELRGTIDYDLAKLQGLLAPYLGEGVAVTGRSSREFALAGPLDSLGTEEQLNEWTGNASVAWDTLQSYGFAAKQGVLSAQLAAGKLEIAPLNFEVNEGRFRLTPTVLIAPAPGEIRLPREQVLEQVRVTPQMCAQALAYIAPVMAGVAEADGRFSVALDGGRLPLNDFRQGDVSGKLTVHDVRVSAGPLVAALAVVMSRPTEVRLKQEATVPFRLVQGRVYHENLELNFPEMTIRTRGSVGLDRSLAILAEMPVPPKWIGNNPLGQAIQGQTISLPIGGTLDRPVIDQNELNRLAAQFIQNAAGRALQNELGRQLDRLLGPQQ